MEDQVSTLVELFRKTRRHPVSDFDVFGWRKTFRIILTHRQIPYDDIRLVVNALGNHRLELDFARYHSPYDLHRTGEWPYVLGAVQIALLREKNLPTPAPPPPPPDKTTTTSSTGSSARSSEHDHRRPHTAGPCRRHSRADRQNRAQSGRATRSTRRDARQAEAERKRALADEPWDEMWGAVPGIQPRRRGDGDDALPSINGEGVLGTRLAFEVLGCSET